MKVKDIQKNFARVSEVFSQRPSPAASSVTERTSALWQDVFDSRINFPSVDEFMIFRRNGATYGVGDPAYSDPALLVRHCQKNALLLRGDGVTEEFLGKLGESSLGAPRVSSDHALSFEASPNYLKNLRNAFRIYQWVKYRIGDKAINICEIGAGYGLLASMLHQLFEVRSYTIIDLPQNLYLTSMYLTSLYPQKSFQFIEQSREAMQAPQDLNFVFAADISTLKGEFDLIINTDSFGEMTRETAADYVRWARDNLAPEGVLHTDNRVRVRGNSAAMSFSDLGYLTGYEILNMDGTRTQAELLSQPHHICFFKVAPGRTYPAKPWDLASMLYTLGLPHAIQTHVENAWSDTRADIVDAALLLLTTESARGREQATRQLEGLREPPVFVNFLVFLVRFAQGKRPADIPAFAFYLTANMTEPADAVARIIELLVACSGPAGRRLDELQAAFNAKYPHLAEDLSAMIPHPQRSLRALQAFAAQSITARSLDPSLRSRILRRITGDYLA